MCSSHRVPHQVIVAQIDGICLRQNGTAKRHGLDSPILYASMHSRSMRSGSHLKRRVCLCQCKQWLALVKLSLSCGCFPVGASIKAVFWTREVRESTTECESSHAVGAEVADRFTIVREYLAHSRRAVELHAAIAVCLVYTPPFTLREYVTVTFYIFGFVSAVSHSESDLHTSTENRQTILHSIRSVRWAHKSQMRMPMKMTSLGKVNSLFPSQSIRWHLA